MVPGCHPTFQDLQDFAYVRELTQFGAPDLGSATFGVKIDEHFTGDWSPRRIAQRCRAGGIQRSNGRAGRKARCWITLQADPVGEATRPGLSAGFGGTAGIGGV